MPKTLYLVDGSSYLYRAFHALPPLANARGEPTGALFGVANMLRRLLREENPEYVAIVFDAKGKTFRHELYDQYKANRPPMPDDLRVQIPPLLEVVKCMGLPLLQESGVEADDVIGTLTRQAREAGFEVVISTGDKDLAQLVEDGVVLINTMNNTCMDVEGVVDKFGVRPDQVIDYLALVGDSSDNIPGVPKVGPKTASKWLNQYDSLDNIINNAHQIKGKVGESLRDSIDQLTLSRTLATIRLDLSLTQNPAGLRRQDAEQAKLGELVRRYNFTSWMDEQDPGIERAPGQRGDYQVILTESALDEWLDRLRSSELFAVDTETTSLDYSAAEIVGLSFACEEGSAAYLPLGHRYPGVPAQLDRDTSLAKLKPLLENPDLAKVTQHGKYDMNVLARYDITLRGVAFDTMLESYCLNASGGRHDMDSLAMRYLNYATVHFEQIAGKGKQQLTFDQIELDQAAPYAAEDADITLRLHHKIWPQLLSIEGSRSVFEEIEVPLIPVLAGMEQTGVLIDTAMLGRHSNELATRLAAIEIACHELAGHRFNLGSPKQLQAILFEEQGIPVVRKTPKGQPSTAEDVLQELAPDYPLPAKILEYRGLAKLKSTYTDRLPEQVRPHSGRVHTSYHQAVAATGRLSSSDPNLQNIPIRTAEGRRVRQAFIAPPGFCIMAADYSQIELRIMAHLSADETLLAAFNEGRDVHAATAAEVFGDTPEGVSSDHRRAAKAINFGLMYGMSAFGLAKQLGTSRGEAQAYIDTYFARYPGVQRFMDEVREKAREEGYVETLFGRRLYLPEIKSRNPARRQGAERAAINAPMQGTAADIIKRAMLTVYEWLDPEMARLTMQVHDELVFEVAMDNVEEIQAGVVARMVDAAALAVPLVVDVGVGDNWQEAH